MTSTLEDVASAADDAADDQRRIARMARAMQRRRDRGWSWTRVLDEQQAPGLIALLRRSGRRISDVTARLTRTIAAELRSEGASHRNIAGRLGVSHQRVSAMLSDRGAGMIDE